MVHVLLIGHCRPGMGVISQGINRTSHPLPGVGGCVGVGSRNRVPSHVDPIILPPRADFGGRTRLPGVSENPYARFMGSEIARPEQHPRERKTHSHDLIRPFEQSGELSAFSLACQFGISCGLAESMTQVLAPLRPILFLCTQTRPPPKADQRPGRPFRSRGRTPIHRSPSRTRRFRSGRTRPGLNV